eukprot:CAMPEP_0195114128 /NCGR_PEP_ID=MMETSP0448-20130528/105091_1 /TAXON_ID=66468 /ORGANISM="Heterocapsa triquestra, Strain CCMP 448" /LENGTH=835 /DNA_ID=CAMNT_0040151143 /DNA_START=1 /DNA_END=2508 /DNA_ORIENTATION=-
MATRWPLLGALLFSSAWAIDAAADSVAAAKRPGVVDASRTSNGVGYFAILGDWGNPFEPGTGESDDAYWGPHWKCNTDRGDSTRCLVGSPEWQRDEYAQTNVSQALTKYARENEVQFVVNVGDNLYPAGFESPEDPLWKVVFEDRYADASLQVPWLSALGNHDWGGFDCYMRDGRLYRGDAQVGYDTEPNWTWPQSKATRWVMPAEYYKKRIEFGDTTMDIFVVSTHWADEAEVCGQDRYAQRRCDAQACFSVVRNMADTMWNWLEVELPASDADWKFVVGHRPIDSLGRWLRGTQNIVELLTRNNVSMYISGHRHTLEEHWHTALSGGSGVYSTDGPRPGAVFEVVSGAAGGSYSDGLVQGLSRWGFNGVRVTPDTLEVDYLSDSGGHLYTAQVPKPCAQYGNNSCGWEVPGAWEPALPCCSDPDAPADACLEEGTVRTRAVLCSGGAEGRCANTMRPEASQTCGAQPPTSTATTMTTTTTTSIANATVILVVVHDSFLKPFSIVCMIVVSASLAGIIGMRVCVPGAKKQNGSCGFCMNDSKTEQSEADEDDAEAGEWPVDVMVAAACAASLKCADEAAQKVEPALAPRVESAAPSPKVEPAPAPIDDIESGECLTGAGGCTTSRSNTSSRTTATSIPAAPAMGLELERSDCSEEQEEESEVTCNGTDQSVAEEEDWRRPRAGALMGPSAASLSRPRAIAQAEDPPPAQPPSPSTKETPALQAGCSLPLGATTPPESPETGATDPVPEVSSCSVLQELGIRVSCVDEQSSSSFSCFSIPESPGSGGAWQWSAAWPASELALGSEALGIEEIGTSPTGEPAVIGSLSFGKNVVSI